MFKRTTHINLRIWRILSALVLIAWTGSVPAVYGVESPFTQDPELTTLIRIQSLNGLREEFRRLLVEIYPDTTVTDPVGNIIGEYLVNPDLRNLSPETYFEIASFNPNTAQTGTTAAAFIVSDPARYRRALASQTNVRQEEVSDDITTYRREISAGRSTTFYLTVTPGNVAIFGHGREAVRRARELYLASGARGLLQNSTSDVTAGLHVNRLVAIQDEHISRSLERLRTDLLQDLAPGSPPEHPLGLFLGEVMRQMHSQLRQIERIQIDFDMQQDALSLGATIVPTAESGFDTVLAAARPRNSKLDLVQALDSKAVYWNANLLWPELNSESLASIGTIAAAAAGGLLDRDTRTRALSIQDTLMRAGPNCFTSALLGATDNGSINDVYRVQLIRWDKPALVVPLLDRINAFVHSAPLRELLSQHGANLSWSRQTNIAQVGQLPVGALHISAQHRASSPSPGDRASGETYVYHRSFIYGIQGDVTVFVTSSTLSRKGAEITLDDPGFKQALRILHDTLQRIATPTATPNGESAPPDEPRTTQKDEPLLGLVSLNPTEWMRLALFATGRSRLADAQEQQGRSMLRAATEFAEYSTDAPPLTIRMLAPDGDLRLALQFPRKTLVIVARACLGLGAGEEKEALE